VAMVGRGMERREAAVFEVAAELVLLPGARWQAGSYIGIFFKTFARSRGQIPVHAKADLIVASVNAFAQASANNGQKVSLVTPKRPYRNSRSRIWE